MKEGIVLIHGQEYETVASRLKKFCEKFPVEDGWSIQTEVLKSDNERVIVKASFFIPDGKLLRTGHAEEFRNSSQINKTSALENAETSAIGRLLANSGFLSQNIASAEEVLNATRQQEHSQKQYSQPQQKSYPKQYQKEPYKKEPVQVPNLEDEEWIHEIVPHAAIPKVWEGKNLTWMDLATNPDLKFKSSRGNLMTGLDWAEWRSKAETQQDLKAVWQTLFSMAGKLKMAELEDPPF